MIYKGSDIDQGINIHILEAHHHTFAYGHTHALAEYLIKYVPIFLFVQHAFEQSRFYPSTAQLYKSNKLARRIISSSIRAPDILLFFKDLFLTLIFTLQMKRRFHFYIGADALNALSGIFLHKLRFTQFVILFAIDYTPRRFDNMIYNFLYHTLNLIVASHCDLIWVVSKRLKHIYQQVYRTRRQIIVVPAGANRPEVISMAKVIHNRIVFLGNLDKSKGLQLAINAMPQIKKQIPKVELIVIGTGKYYNDLKKLVEELNLENTIKFIGHVPNHQDVMRMLEQCDIGLAPYVPDATSISVYGTPGKVPEYLIAGLSVIVTDVPEIAREVSAVGAGIVINYEVESLTNAVIYLLSDQDRLQTHKENAFRLGQKYLWDKIFDNTMEETIRILGKKIDQHSV